jgi:pyrimidine operon attenuation protein/uracil phosphoribosyltransferase
MGQHQGHVPVARGPASDAGRVIKPGEPMVRTRIMDAGQVGRTVRRLAFEVLERNRGVENVVLVGIRERGARLSELLAEVLQRVEMDAVPTWTLDVRAYRDDRDPAVPIPAPSEGPDLADRDVVLVDDVLFTGRTARAALDAVVRFGRPRSIQLAVLVDRGHREYPIQADFVGRAIPTRHTERVVVDLGDDPSVAVEE